MVALVALTFKSRRTIEYLVPVLVLWLATMWTMIEPRQCLNQLWEDWRRLFKRQAAFCSALLVVIVRFMGRISGHCAR